MKAEKTRRIQKALKSVLEHAELDARHRDYFLHEVEDGIVDLLANLRHLCDKKKLDFGDLDRKANHHYLEEK